MNNESTCKLHTNLLRATIGGATVLWLTAAAGAPYSMMFESDADALGGVEVAFRTFDTFTDLLGNTANAPDRFSPINVSPSFSTTGLTWDGLQYIMMFESDADTPAGAEVAFRTFNTFTDLLGNTANAPDRFSPINVSPSFSTTGLTWDGFQYIMMFESDADALGGVEVAFRTFDTFIDLLGNTANAADRFSPINVSPSFSTTGLTWDGFQYIMMFESDADALGGVEVAFRTFDTFTDLLGNTANAADRFSPINVSPSFSTTGLAVEWVLSPPPDDRPLPVPGTLALLSLGLAVLGYSRRSIAASRRRSERARDAENTEHTGPGLEIRQSRNRRMLECKT